MRICIAYDCLFPWTVGGAERWYRALAERLVADGHDVTYLTRRQWPDGEQPQLLGVQVVAVSRADALYGQDGRRRITPPLRFGLGVFLHLVRSRRRYDAIHLCSFPYFSLMGARLALAGARATITVDWFEVWTRTYWREYLGRVGGLIGSGVQSACVRLTPRAMVFSELHERRLRALGMRAPIVRLRGLWAGAPRGAQPSAGEPPTVVFAGRHIPEKRVPSIPAAVAHARQVVPGLRARILGDGPDRDLVVAEVARFGLEDVIAVPGFVDHEEVEAAMADATCILLPSRREGYGLVVVEAAQLGTPAVVVAGPDNAAVELVADGVNGIVAADDDPRTIGAAIARAHEAGDALRAGTRAWFDRFRPELSLEGSLDAVLRAYRGEIEH